MMLPLSHCMCLHRNPRKSLIYTKNGTLSKLDEDNNGLAAMRRGAYFFKAPKCILVLLSRLIFDEQFTTMTLKLLLAFSLRFLKVLWQAPEACVFLVPSFEGYQH
jgi:hypothetical protein